MVEPSVSEPTVKTVKKRSKPNTSSARKKKTESDRNVEMSMRIVEENIRGAVERGEKNPIIGEILYNFKEKLAPTDDEQPGVESANNILREFVEICKVSVTARLVTDDDEISKVSKPRKRGAPKKNVEPKPKAPKKEKAAAVKVAKKPKTVNSSQILKDYNSIAANDTLELIEPIEVTKPEKAPSEQEVPVPGTEESSEVLNDTLEFDLLSTKPRKKSYSNYSYLKHKKTFCQKNYFVGEDDVKINMKEMTMHDLIFFNPPNNPMSKKDDPKKKISSQIEETSQTISRLEEEAVDDVDEEESEMPVPQLKLSADGQIILDPKSLVVQTSAEKSLKALQNSDIIEENGNTFNRFSKAKKKHFFWTPLETLRFYRALNTIGTDFTLMQTVFPNRTRHDLKKKFKKEERTNKELIDKALSAAAEFDIEMLEDDIKKDSERAEIQRKAKEEKERLLKEEKEEKKKKRKASNIKPLKTLALDDTGDFENRITRAQNGICVKRQTFDDMELDEPQFDSLYLSEEEDNPPHLDHSYVKRWDGKQKMIKGIKREKTDIISINNPHNNQIVKYGENANYSDTSGVREGAENYEIVSVSEFTDTLEIESADSYELANTNDIAQNSKMVCMNKSALNYDIVDLNEIAENCKIYRVDNVTDILDLRTKNKVLTPL